MKVNKSDLKGELKGFPIEVVQRMCECQVEQGNEFNPKVFAGNLYLNKYNGGFYWEDTIEGEDFWNKVVYGEKFNVFFDKYPKVTKEIVQWQNPSKDICKIKHRVVVDFDLTGATKKGLNKLLKEKLKDIYKNIKLQ